MNNTIDKLFYLGFTLFFLLLCKKVNYYDFLNKESIPASFSNSQIINNEKYYSKIWSKVFISNLPEPLHVKNKKEIKISIIDTIPHDPMLVYNKKVFLKKIKNGKIAERKKNINHGVNIANIVSVINDEVLIDLYPSSYKNIEENYGIHSSIYNAIQEKTNIINMSYASDYFDKIEYDLIKKASDQGIIIIVAAGNDAQNLDEKCDVFPACYKHYDKNNIIKNMYVVGSLKQDGEIADKSNYGKIVDFYTFGDNLVLFSNDKSVDYISGTSFAAPMVAGLISTLNYDTENLAHQLAINYPNYIKRGQFYVKN